MDAKEAVGSFSFSDGSDPGQERLLYIASAARSGSTALSFLLGQHSKILAGSQLEWLRVYAELGRRTPCTCGSPTAECPFWRSVAERFAAIRGLPVNYFFHQLQRQTTPGPRSAPLDWALAHAAYGMARPGLIRAASRCRPAVEQLASTSRLNHELFRALRLISGKPVVVDSSKLAVRGKALYVVAPAAVRLIWLVRDGRGVAWSRMRRHGESMQRAASVWLRANLELATCLATVPIKHRLRVRYEDLCEAPQRELNRICELVEVPFEPFTRTLRKRETHLLGGNEMRYRHEEGILKVDDSWRDNLTRKDLAIFHAIAGFLNRRFGYR